MSTRTPIAGRRTVHLHIQPSSPWRRLALSGVALLALLSFGVAGYMAIEGWSFLDALYMTVTTVTTVGFREVQPLGNGGRIFTIFVILFGVGVALYILTTVVQTTIERELAATACDRRLSPTVALRLLVNAWCRDG